MEVAQPPRDVLYCVHPRTASTLPRLVSTPGGPGLKQHQVDFAHDRVCGPQSRRSHRHERLSCRFTTRGSSLDCLQRLISPQQYEDLVVRHPEVLSSAFDSPINSWVDFLDTYGLDRTAISKLLLQCPELITCTSIYEAGRTLLFFRHLGWKYEQIRGRIIAQYPQVLTKQIERDIQPVIHELAGLGCTPPDIKLLVWEYPRIFTVGKDYRRHIRKFQYLELYGLKLPGRNSSSSSSSSSRQHAEESDSDSGSDSDGYCSRGVRDSLEWLLMTVQN